MDDSDPRDDIERLEAQSEQNLATIESCRKFILASRVALVTGGVLMVGAAFGLTPADATVLVAALAALLGGVVLAGTNRSTADEATAQMHAAEARRAALIDRIDLHVVEDRDRLPARREW